MNFKQGATITFNVNSYIDAFLNGNKKGLGVSNFISLISSSIDRIIEELGVNIVFVVTQHMDLKITEDVISNIKHRDKIRLFTNLKYGYKDIAGVLSRADLHVGMRTHSLILAASVCTPVVGIIAYPKNLAFMKTIEQEEHIIEFNNISQDRLVNVIKKAWEERDQIRKSLAGLIGREKDKAREGALLLEPFINGKRE